MKRQALAETVQKHFHQIEKYSNRIPGSFEVEDVHELRVEYKKSRAFLRLLQLEPGAGHLQMPAKLKAIYQAAGKVRDLQLFLSILTIQVPAYIESLKKELFAVKAQLVEAIEKVKFKKIAAGIEKELPHHLQEATVQKFILQKTAAIHIILLAADHEKDLHDIRKHVKDVIYNLRIFENDLNSSFPPMQISHEQLTAMATQLGDFNDICMAVSLIQSHSTDEAPEEEKKLLDRLRASWLQQKEEQQDQLLQQLQQLKPQHNSFEQTSI